MEMELGGAGIEHVVENVFATAMGVEVSPAQVQFQAMEGRLIGAVYVSGQWEGAVLLQCSPHQACLFTGRFASTEPPESVNEDVRDVVGELTNMIAGGLKSTVLKSIKISLPTVVEGGLTPCRCAAGTC